MPSPAAPDIVSALQRENARLRRAVEELSILNELSREIGASRDLDDVLGKILRRSLRAVRAEQGVVTLIDEAEPTPSRTLVRTAVDAGHGAPMRLHGQLEAWMHLHKRPLCMNDPGRDARMAGAAVPAGLRSVLSVPLLVRARLIGLLTVYNARAVHGFTGDDERLLAILASQSAQVIENARLHEEELQLRHVQKELQLAHEIQRTLLPRQPPALAGYDVGALSLPAESVGGDFFDYVPLSDAQTALCVGDVSGKGLAAALLMANVQATLRGQTVPGRGAEACLGRANRMLHASLRRGSFVTVFYGILDVATHRLTYANAGHNRPLLCSDDGAVRRLETAGLVLGVVPDVAYEAAASPLAPGEVLLVYSDGVTEAMNAQRDQFGEERLVDVLRAHRRGPVDALLDAVVEAVRRHAGEAPQSDDLTLLAIRRA